MHSTRDAPRLLRNRGVRYKSPLRGDHTSASRCYSRCLVSRAYRLLLIDDSEISINFARAVLEGCGYQVHAVTDVAKIDTDLADWVPDLILTDVNMPDLSGDQLCKMLKAHYDTAHVPVVLFSSLANEELEKLSRECHADGFLTKRDGLGQLCDHVETLCRELLW